MRAVGPRPAKSGHVNCGTWSVRRHCGHHASPVGLSSLWSAVDGIVQANTRKQSSLAQFSLILTLFAVLTTGPLQAFTGTPHDRSGRLRVRSTVGQLATLLWPCCSRLAAVCWDQHAGTMQSKSMDGSLHSVSPASALNRRPIQVLTARLIDAASSYPCQTPSTLMPEELLAAITQRAAAPNVVKQATI